MPNWNDGGLKWGSRKVKFYTPGAVDGNGNTTWTALLTSASPVYILEVNSPNRPQFVQKQYDEIRQPNGAFGVDDFVELSATVQFGPGQNFVTNGCAFATVLDNSPGATAEGFVVISTDEPESQGDIRKQNIRLQKIYKATLPTTYP